MKKVFFLLVLVSHFFISKAQDEERGSTGDEQRGGFKKENLFVGGDVTLGFGSGFTAWVPVRISGTASINTLM